MGHKKILTKIKIEDIDENNAKVYISYNPKTEMFAHVNYNDNGEFRINYINENNNATYNTKSSAILEVLYKLKDERNYSYTALCKDDLNLKIDYYKKEIVKEFKRK